MNAAFSEFIWDLNPCPLATSTSLACATPLNLPGSDMFGVNTHEKGPVYIDGWFRRGGGGEGAGDEGGKEQP